MTEHFYRKSKNAQTIAFVRFIYYNYIVKLIKETMS